MIEIVKDDPGFPDALEYYHTQGEIEQIKRRQAFDIMSRKIQRANDAIEKHTGKNVNKLTNLELNAARTKLRIDNFTGMFILGPEKVTASMKISGLEFPETLVTAEPTALRQAGPTPSVTKTPQGLGYPGPSRSKSSRSSTKRPVAKSPFQEPDENTQGLLSKLMETLTGSAKKAPEPEDLRSTLPFDFERLPDTPVRTKSTLTKNIAAASTASPKKKSTDLLPAKRLTRSPTKKINDLPVATMLAPIKKVAVTTTKKKSAPIPSVSSAEPPVEVRPARRPTRSPTKKLNDPFDSKSARCASGGTEAFHATKLGDISSVESSKTSLTKKKRLAENTLADQSSPKKSKRETPGRRKGN
jgi:hypothetical protein